MLLFFSAIPAAALTPVSSITEVMAEQKEPGFYLEFRYTIDFLYPLDLSQNYDYRILGSGTYWGLDYLGLEKPGAIESELYPDSESEVCKKPQKRLLIFDKDGAFNRLIGAGYFNAWYARRGGLGGVFNSYIPPSRTSPLYHFSFICINVELVKLHEIKCEDFISCIAGKISKKFPFDILFNLPSTQITCPRVNFFGSEFDICFIYEAMRLMKYPIAAALIIKLFLYL